MSNLLTLEQLRDEISDLGRVILVIGNFNILHPGHIRLLRFAKSCGDTLVVAVNCDEIVNDTSYNDEHHRADVVSSLEYVDKCFIATENSGVLIDQLRPWGIVKGKEYESKNNPEKEYLDSYGGRLIFSSGNTLQKSASIFGKAPSKAILDVKKLNGYSARHEITSTSIESLLARFCEQKILVIGDSIVDEYMQCNAVGMSQEDPTIVVTPDESKHYLGGAAITAAHAKSLGAKSVSFFTVLGDDQPAEFVKNKLAECDVNASVFVDETRPTTLKKRYRVGNKTLLRVNQVRDHDIEIDIQSKLWDRIQEELQKTNVVIFSDFNYGVLPQSLVDKITRYCRQNDIMISADSQTSSQVGDISRFKNVDLITPTEREVRVALNNSRDGLVILAEKLRQKTHCNNVIVTLGEEGAFIHLPTQGTKEPWANDKIPALAMNVEDPAGAGDCMLAATSLALASGGNLWTAALIGSVAAACQVSRVGNSPLQHRELKKAAEQLVWPNQ